MSQNRTGWDAVGSPLFNEEPPAGTKWALDIENKPQGSAAINELGLNLSVTTSPAPTKIRFQYYLGSRGYPTIDSQSPKLATVFAQPLSWDQTLQPGGHPSFGVGLQIQLEKLNPETNKYTRVTITNTATAGTGPRNLVAANWFANTDMYYFVDGVKTRELASPRFLTTGVTPAVLLDNFGDYNVVSFGPNLGRDYSYDYRIQDFTILGQTFHFTNVVPPVDPPADPPTVPGISVIEPPVIVIARPPLVAGPPAPSTPTATAPTITTPPPAPTTQARVLAEVGATTAELLTLYGAANGGATPPPISQVLTVASTSQADSSGRFDAGTPLTASVPWDASIGDQWVDVWGLSSPTYIGTYPVIGGVLRMTNADLSSLGNGDHHLVFVGQTSGANQVVAMTLASPAASNAPTAVAGTLASTTNDPTGFAQVWIVWLVIVLLLLAAGTLVITRVRRSRSKGLPSA